MEEIVRIFHPSLETPLVLSPAAVQVLAVEAPREFYRLVGSLDAQLGGGEGEFSFLRDGKEIAADAQGKYDLSKAGLYTVRFSVSDAYGVSSSDQIYLVVSEQQ